MCLWNRSTSSRLAWTISAVRLSQKITSNALISGVLREVEGYLNSVLKCEVRAFESFCMIPVRHSWLMSSKSAFSSYFLLFSEQLCNSRNKALQVESEWDLDNLLFFLPFHFLIVKQDSKRFFPPVLFCLGCFGFELCRAGAVLWSVSAVPRATVLGFMLLLGAIAV